MFPGGLTPSHRRINIGEVEISPLLKVMHGKQSDAEEQ
jgi:hypothetical protein